MTDDELDASARAYYAAVWCKRCGTSPCRCEFPDALVIEDGAPEAEEAQPARKRKKAVPTTARTLAECRRRGWIAGVVERRIPFPKPRGTKIDLFGVIDVVAIAPGVKGVIGIQSTANIGGHHAKHRDKILAELRARQWLEAGNRLELWTWAKQGARGKAKRWTLRVEVFEVDQWRSPTNGGTSSGVVVSQGGVPS